MQPRPPPPEWFIERIEPERMLLISKLEEWIRLRRAGWNLVVLVHDEKTKTGLRTVESLLAFGHRGLPERK